MEKHITTLGSPTVYGKKAPPYWWVDCTCGWQSEVRSRQDQAEELAEQHRKDNA